MLAGTTIVLAGFLGTGTGGPARAGGPSAAAAAVPAASTPGSARSAALTAYGLPGWRHRPGRPARWPRARQHHPARHHPARHHSRRHGPRVHGTPRRIARSLLAGYHWAQWQFRYLNLLWMRESGWNRFAANPSSGAYGIPQAVPGDKMASAGPDWRSSARTQIIWGMGYIRECYGTPWRAWQHELADGWY